MPEYYIEYILRVPHKNNLSTGILPTQDPIIKSPNYDGNHIHCMLYKNAVMPDQNYIPHSSEVWFGKSSDQESLKEGMIGNLGNSDKAVNLFFKAKT